MLRLRWSLSPALLLAGAFVLSGCGGSSSTSSTSTPSSSQSSSSGNNMASLGLLKSDVLTVGTDPTYPPMEYSDPNNPGTYIGADVDLATALAKAMGLKSADVTKGTFDSLIPSLDAGRYDVLMSSMNDTPDRAKKVDFVDYMTATMGILVDKSSSIHANDFSGMCGHSVAVQRGTVEQDDLKAANAHCSSKITILSYSADTDAFQAFAAGHADAYSGDLPVVANYIKLHSSSYRMAGASISAHANYGIAVPKNKTQLKAALVSALAKIRASGQYLTILKKWNVQGAALH